MHWKRETHSTHTYRYEVLITIFFVLLLLSLFTGYMELYIVVGLFSVYTILYTLYDRKMERKITLKNKKQTIRLFPGEESILTFELHNHSGYPAINAQFTFETGTPIKAAGRKQVKLSYQHWYTYTVPAALVRNGKTTLKIPVRAEQRGPARIGNIVLSFPHLYNFDDVILRYVPFYHLEVLVYPEILPVQGIERFFEVTPGSKQNLFSPFEDIQSTQGLRDYTIRDGLHRINWKASAKTQKLQTNVYDKVIDISYVFIVNVGMKYKGVDISQWNETLEKILSHTAYLCQYATERELPYSIYINTRKSGNKPYLYMTEGEGKTHFARALEMLARVRQQSMIIPFDQMLYSVKTRLIKTQSIVVIGDVSDESAAVMNMWRRREHNVSQVKMADVGAVMIPWAY